jgi:hypothetical protein
VEELERRLTPSFTVSIDDRVSTIACDNAGNTVAVDHSAGFTLVAGQSFEDALFDSVRVNTGTGGDTVNLLATPPRPLTVNEGAGGNVTVNLSPEAHTLNTIPGDVTVNGGAGIDTLVVNDQSGPANQTYTLAANSLTRSGASTVHIGGQNVVTVNGSSGANTYNVNGTGAINLTTLNTGGGNDTVNVAATGFNDPLTINEQGSGNDTVTVGSSANLDFVPGVVTVRGNSGFDSLVINDQASSPDHDYTLTGSSLTRTGGAAVVISHLPRSRRPRPRGQRRRRAGHRPRHLGGARRRRRHRGQRGQ